MTPDQRNLVLNAIKNIRQNNDSLDLDDFCGLFQNIDSEYHSVLPRWQSKFCLRVTAMSRCDCRARMWVLH